MQSGICTQLERALVLLGETPRAGPVWEHGEIPPRVRRIPLRRFPFVLFYAIDATSVRMLAVAHTSRDPGYWTSRLGGVER